MDKSFKKVLKKNVKISPVLLNKIVKVYNGKTFYELNILPNMIGYKIGGFILTKTKKK